MRMLLVILLMLSSCVGTKKSSMSFPQLDLKLTEEWIYAESIQKLKYDNEVITRPPGFEQLVMEVVIPAPGGLLRKKHCLYYQVPYKEKPGRMRVQEMKSGGDCPDVSSEDEPFIEIVGLKDLKVAFADFKIVMDFEYEKAKRKIMIPLPNIELGVIHEKYHAMREKRMKTGMTLLRLNEDSFDFASNKYLGKLADRFSKGSAIRCQQVGKDCQIIGENRCGECRYGWYEVVDFQCPGGGSKFCGQNHCGEKGEPACPRGVKVVMEEEAGICQSDLSPVVNADKILVCQ